MAVDLHAVIQTQNLIHTSVASLDEVMQLVVERVQALTGGTGAVVELAEGAEMVYRAVGGSASGSLGVRLRSSGSLSGLCVATETVLRCDDSETDPRVDREACRRVGARSMVVAPLIHQRRTVGVLKVLSSAPYAFDDCEVETVELMAEFIAASLAHAHRFDDLARRNQALDQFTAHVAHDLQHPMAIMTMAGATLGKLLGDDAPEVTELLSIIETQAGVGAEMISSLLALARANRAPRRSTFELGQVVEEAAHGIAGMTLDNHCGGVMVDADWVAIRQALTNLLSNGARYAAVAGTATMAVRCEESPDGWRVEVADRGPGLEPDERDRVFGAFERGRHATALDGTGLGLAIVATVAQAHGGQAGHEPRAGGGSVFWFSVGREGAV